MISVARLCQPFLLSFMATKSKDGQTNNGTSPRAEDSEVDSDDSDDETMPSSTLRLAGQAHTTKTPFNPATDWLSLEKRLEPLLQQPFNWVAKLQPS